MNQTGFSLVDVLLAVGLVSLSAVATLNVKDHANRSLTRQKLVEETQATRRHIRESFSCLQTIQAFQPKIKDHIDQKFPKATEIDLIPLAKDGTGIFADNKTLYSDKKIKVLLTENQDFHFRLEDGNQSRDIFNGIPFRCADVASMSPLPKTPTPFGTGCQDIAITGRRRGHDKNNSHCESLANGRCALRMESFTNNTSGMAGTGIMELKGKGACSIRMDLVGTRPGEPFNCAFGYKALPSTPPSMRQNCTRNGGFDVIGLPPKWSFVFPAKKFAITNKASGFDFKITTGQVMPSGWHYHDTDLTLQYLDCSGNPIGNQCRIKLDLISPLVFNPQTNSPPKFIELGDSRARFDLNLDGQREQTAWVPEGWYFIAFDSNNNGRIDDGSELFGASSVHANGFEALSIHDSNGDGWIDQDDDDFQQLLVWRDDGDGFSQPNELTKLAESELARINLKYSSDFEDQETRSSKALYSSESDCKAKSCTVYDVFFQTFTMVKGDADER